MHGSKVWLGRGAVVCRLIRVESTREYEETRPRHEGTFLVDDGLVLNVLCPDCEAAQVEHV